MWHRDRVRRNHGELSTPPPTPTSRGALDDTTLAPLGSQVACEPGPELTSADIAAEWVEHLPAAELQGGGFGRAFLDVLRQLRRGEAPADGDRAAAYAERDASTFSTGNGVHAAQFVAATASRLMVDPDISSEITTAREYVWRSNGPETGPGVRSGRTGGRKGRRTRG